MPTPEQVEQLNGVDIPAGAGRRGSNTIGAPQRRETISLIQRKLVIPMHYKTPASKQELEPLDRFLKEIGAKTANEERQPKISVTKSTLPDETKIQVLDYKGADKE